MTTRSTYVIGDHCLSADCRRVEAEFPSWHVWFSDAGIIHATSCLTCYGGSGVTLEARTPELMRWEIARFEREIARVAA